MRRFMPWLLGLALVLSTVALVFAQGDNPNPPPPGPGGMTPAMRQQMMAMMQDMMVMMQNTTVWTPQGTVVLQGNRLLIYAPDLATSRILPLPLPAAPATPPGAMPVMPSLRSQVPAKLLPTNDGLLVVRGQQLIRLDRNFRIVNQAMLPDLPPLTAAETAAVCPMCEQMMAMMSHMGGMQGMGGGGMTPPAE